MRVRVNNDPIEFNGENRLSVLLKELSMNEKNGIAIAVNAEVVPKKEWLDFLIRENDDIIIIEAAQSG